MLARASTDPRSFCRLGRRGYVLILPGVMNVAFPLAWLARTLRQAHPGYVIEIRTWGIPFGSVANLRDFERNLRRAEAIAADIGAYRRLNPEADIHVIGYSGGGGVAVLAVAALSGQISINRLLLVAPAISSSYPVVERVLPKVSEFVVNYASRRDWHITYGTRFFGNVDGIKGPGAGAVGFAVSHPKLLEVHWHRGMLRDLHPGGHYFYLSPLWQRRYLVPALSSEHSLLSLRDVFGLPPA